MYQFHPFCCRKAMSKRRKKEGITYTFCTIKCKLRAVTKSSAVTDRLNEVAILAHDIFKRASLFLRAYCLQATSFPPMTMSTIRHCINCVCSRESSGRRPKDDSLGEDIGHSGSFTSAGFILMYWMERD